MFSPRRCAHALNLLINNRQYFIARIKVILDQPMRPNDPWLTRDAITFLQAYLREDMVGFEFGSGRSTSWFARRVSRLISVEDNPVWYRRVKQDLSCLKVDYRYISTNAGCITYVNQLLSFSDASFDFIVIDGSCRDACISVAARKVKPGGVIVLDNADERRDVSPLSTFERHSTHNGISQTDIYVRASPTEDGQQIAATSDVM